MNKLILLLPKPILKNYVLAHFSELTVEDFFEIADKVKFSKYYFEKNDKLNSSSDVLSYMLDIDPYSYDWFDKNAFSAECIDKLAALDVVIPADIDKYPILLTNDKILESVIKAEPNIVKKLSENQITDKVISILENSAYIPDYNDIIKSPLFLNSEKLLKRAIEKTPELILKIEKLSDTLVSTALKKGFIPEKNHFYTIPQFKNYDELLKTAFANDPSVIVFFSGDKLSTSVIQDARERGFIATEEDLMENPSLCNIDCIMEDAIRNNPKLIVFLSKNVSISENLIIETLKKYEITKEDLENHPSLATTCLMNYLPEFKLYSSTLTDEEKKATLISYLKKDQTSIPKDLPFFNYKFGGKFDTKKLPELLNYLTLSLNQNDINVQQSYLQMLDKVIDGIVDIRYKKNKPSFLYPDLVSLNDALIELFKNVSITNDFELISKFADELSSFVEKTIDKEEIKKEIENFYAAYVNNQSVNFHISSEFYNKILNQHKNMFMSIEKQKILKEIENKMKLTPKKMNVILNGRKLQKMRVLIANNEFEQLGVTKEQFNFEIKNIKNIILNNKDIKKSGSQITMEQLDYLVDNFVKNGALDENTVIELLGIKNSEVIKYIVNKFEQIKIKLANNVMLSNEESFISTLDRSKLGGVNCSNYLIFDNDRYIDNLSELLLKLDDDTLDKILSNKHLLKEITCLLPLIDLIEELDVQTFINILSTYDRIRDKIFQNLDIRENVDYKDLILKNIDNLIQLGNAYNSVDSIHLIALGQEVVSKIGEENSSRYLEFYLKMLNKQKGFIPPISIYDQEQNYFLESGIYSDPERLLIGKIIKEGSCVDLFGGVSGTKTYEDVLLENSGDVILIRDKDKKLISRIFIFRRGNVVQLVASIYKKHSIDLYKKIADQIIQQSISNNDNIDYVFVNTASIQSRNENFVEIDDSRFVTKFPHADLNSAAILLSSKNKVSGNNGIELNLKFDEIPKVSYMKPRKKILLQPTESDIMRIKALNIVMENDLVEKERMSRDFEPIYIESYEKVICGEDWYIAIKKDGSYEQVVLQSKDPRTYEEIEQVKGLLNLSDDNSKSL